MKSKTKFLGPKPYPNQFIVTRYQQKLGLLFCIFILGVKLLMRALKRLAYSLDIDLLCNKTLMKKQSNLHK